MPSRPYPPVRAPGDGEIPHGLLHFICEWTWPVKVGVGERVPNAAVAPVEYLPVTPVSLLSKRSVKVASARIVEEEHRGSADVFAAVTATPTPTTVREATLTQLDFHQGHGAAVVLQPSPQHHVDSRRFLVANWPLAIQLAEQPAGRHPLKLHPLDSQLRPEQSADVLRQLRPLAFAKRQKEVEGERL